MGVVFVENAPSAIEVALKALAVEERDLSEKIDALLARRAALRKAIEAMRPLVDAQGFLKAETTAKLDVKSAWPFPTGKTGESQQVGLSTENESQDEDSDTSGVGSFSGLRFSQALLMFMKNVKVPMNTTEIAKQFEDAGWRFRSDNQTHKVNQVGVTLRRLKGRFFDITDDGRWFAL